MPKQPTPREQLAKRMKKGETPTDHQVASWNLQRMRGMARGHADAFVAKLTDDQVKSMADCDDGEEMTRLLDEIEETRPKKGNKSRKPPIVTTDTPPKR